MKKLLVAAVCLGLFAVAANAQYNIHFYFSKQGDASGIPAEYTGAINPLGGQPLYLWAFVQDDGGGGGNPFGEWNGVALGLDRAVTGEWYQQPVFGTNRWEPTSVLTWTPNYQGGLSGGFGVAVNARGLGNPDMEALAAPKRVVTGTGGYHYIVAATTGAPLANAFLNVGTSGIARKGGTVTLDKIYFGFGDGPLLGNQFGMKSTLPDIVPEPASLLLLGLAGLALRRR